MFGVVGFMVQCFGLSGEWGWIFWDRVFGIIGRVCQVWCYGICYCRLVSLICVRFYWAVSLAAWDHVLSITSQCVRCPGTVCVRCYATVHLFLMAASLVSCVNMLGVIGHYV